MLKWIAPFALLLAVPVATFAKQAPAKFDWFEYKGNDGLPKPGPGEYANPILQGFYPDPSIVRVGADYYLVNSTFAWFPGMPIFHSRDLVHWTQIGNAIDRPTQLDLAKTNMGLGLYAPDISFHDGTFYILNTCVGCGGNFVMTAKRPKGPWSDPVWLPDVDGIDTSPFLRRRWKRVDRSQRPPAREAELRRTHGAVASAVRSEDAQDLRQARGACRPGHAPGAETDLDRGAAHLQEGRLLLFDCCRGRDRGEPFGSGLPKRQGDGPLCAAREQSDPNAARPSDERPNPITSTGHAKLVDTPAGEWWAVFLEFGLTTQRATSTRVARRS